MNRRFTGTVFCLISALLFCTKYISAAIVASGFSAGNSAMFKEALHFIGATLNIFSFISLIIGAIYLIMAEYKKEQF